MPKNSKEKVPSPPKTKRRVNPRRRKNKRHDEKESKIELQDVRPGKPSTKVLTTQVFNVHLLRDGDKFTFTSPGKGKRTYICTIKGNEVLFERSDKHSYTRRLDELPSIVQSCRLDCTLI